MPQRPPPSPGASQLQGSEPESGGLKLICLGCRYRSQITSLLRTLLAKARHKATPESRWGGTGGSGHREALHSDVSRGMCVKGGENLFDTIFGDSVLMICDDKNDRNSTENQQFLDKMEM